MRALGVIVVFICTLVFAVIGGLLVAFSFSLFTLADLTNLLTQTFQVQNIHLIIAGIGLFLIIASISTAQITLGKMQREKTIAFNNPDGQVTVSLSAIEDFIKRLSSSMTEIRDLRSNVIAGKKGIEINARVSLWADVNIPQITETIQVIIKNRIQEMLGIEEPIMVRMHVGKIVQKEKMRAKKKEKQEQEIEEATPFRGSIEYGKD
ncbi:MAG: alkaline shock response membrane anchor protein AmaP [Candidatus Omnitrophica bacterium]|nr:alkaline shock response membrane anchor protein AmaP [Candidatus Omnitrophota bacterium]